jgi:hypothetical protein
MAPAAAHSEASSHPAMPRADVQAAERTITPFLESIQSGDIASAYNTLFSDTALASRTAEIQQLTSQTSLINQIFGEISAWEMFKSECPNNRFCRMKYIIHAENGPFFFWFYMYDHGDRWKVSSIVVGDTPAFAF